MKGLINTKNFDDKCFRWCHIRHLNPRKLNPQRITSKDKEVVNTLDYNGISFPLTIIQINKIEKENAIRISVYGYSNSKCYPIRISSEKYVDHIELVLIDNDNDDDKKQHYVYIKDFNRLMFSFGKHKTKKNIFDAPPAMLLF